MDMSRIMQKEIVSEMDDIFFESENLDFYREYIHVEQLYLAGIKEVRTKLEILDDEFHNRFSHNPIHLDLHQRTVYRAILPVHKTPEKLL